MNEVFANQTLAEDGYGKGKSMINKLVDKIKKTGAPIVVGLDPMLDYVPEQIKAAAFQSLERLRRERQKPSGSTTRQSWMQLTI